MGECSVYSSLHAGSKVKFAALCASDSLATYGAIEMCFDWLIDWLAYELAATCCRPTFAQMTQSELSHMAGAVNDSTINIVLVLVLTVLIVLIISVFLFTGFMCIVILKFYFMNVFNIKPLLFFQSHKTCSMIHGSAMGGRGKCPRRRMSQRADVRG